MPSNDKVLRWLAQMAENGGVVTSGREGRTDPAALESAIRALEQPLMQASSWPGDLAGLDRAGLYAWWVDAEGADHLSAGLGLPLAAGRVYAGQTGATRWPSGRSGTTTLRQRLGSNHLSGSIRGSTFRKTLAACLREPLRLRPEAGGKLTRESEQAISAWMRTHLSLAAHAVDDRDSLGDLEKRLLDLLDPPLNLEGRPPTALRRRLTQLRAGLALSAERGGETLRRDTGTDPFDSPFLAIDPASWLAANDLAFAIRDGFPVSPGHALVITRRRVVTWFDATREEQHAVMELVDAVKTQLDEELNPDGYNVGFNAGEAAGQTVMHLHVHVIPRFAGDVPDPRGGVRHVFPDQGNYLAK